jgi:hypothetical protein
MAVVKAWVNQVNWGGVTCPYCCLPFLLAPAVEEGEEPPPSPAHLKAVAIKRLLFSLVFIHAFVQVSGSAHKHTHGSCSSAAMQGCSQGSAMFNRYRWICAFMAVASIHIE